MDDRQKLDRFNDLLEEGNAVLQRGDARSALTKCEEARSCARTIRNAGLARKAEDAASKCIDQAGNREKYLRAGPAE